MVRELGASVADSITGSARQVWYREGAERRVAPHLARCAAALAAAVWAGPALAETCETRPDTVSETFPASGSRGVPLNGVVTILYCLSEDPLIDPADARLLRGLGGGGDSCECATGAECLEVGSQWRCVEEVPAVVSVEDNLVRLESESQLEAETTYVVEAPEPDATLKISFTTGWSVDGEEPVFAGLDSVRIIGCGEGYPANAACPADQDGDGLIAILQADAASDESGLVNLEYLASQVRGDQRIARGRMRGDGAADVTMSVYVPASELSGDDWEELCFAMTARDPYGHESTAGAALCEHTPEYSPFGDACAVSPAPMPGRRGAPPGAGALAILAVLLGLRAASTRSRRRSVRRSPRAG
jgi:hypothetical protein